MSMEGKRSARRVTKVGVVTSNKMDKSVVVRVERMMMHKLYKRYIRRSVKFMAHDESNSCNIGDTVELVESRPLSARKRWRVRRVLRTAVGVEDAKQG
jgi:small subunit ribosomal protein S17